MEIILLERIEKLGQMGDVVSVKAGYARNHLLPQKKAMRATPENMTRFEGQRIELEGINLERRKEAESIGEKLDGLDLVLIRQASERGQLYGSVTARDLTEAVVEAGFNIARRQVQMDQPIKFQGVYPIRIMLHPEVYVEIIANVARTADEASAQAHGGSQGAIAPDNLAPDTDAEEIEVESPNSDIDSDIESGAETNASGTESDKTPS